VRLALGAAVYDPSDPMGKMFFNILATFAEFEVDLTRLRTREGMAVARAKGKLRGKSPKLSAKQQKELRRMYDAGGPVTEVPRVCHIAIKIPCHLSIKVTAWALSKTVLEMIFSFAAKLTDFERTAPC
jgi:DNA invertase Pin-like site-specific DNA recombinase